MTVIIYHNPRCSKSREALNLLRERGIEPRIIEYLKDPPAAETLRHILGMLGCSALDLVRAKEDAFAKAGLSASSSRDEIIQAIHERPELLQRPIIVRDRQAVIGRPPSNVLSLLETTPARVKGNHV